MTKQYTPLNRNACDELDCEECTIANGTGDEICFHSGKLAKYYRGSKED